MTILLEKDFLLFSSAISGVATSDLVECLDLDGLYLVLEVFDSLYNVVDGDLLVLQRETDNELENTKSDRLLLILSLPIETFLGNILENVLSELVQICCVVQWFDLQENKRHCNDDLLFLFLGGFFLGLLGSFLGSTVIFIVVTEKIKIIIIFFLLLRLFFLLALLVVATLATFRGISLDWLDLGFWIPLLECLLGQFDVSARFNKRWKTDHALKPLGNVRNGLAIATVENGLHWDYQVAGDHDISNGHIVADEVVLAIKIFIQSHHVILQVLYGFVEKFGWDLLVAEDAIHGWRRLHKRELIPGNPLVDLGLLEWRLTVEA